MSRRHAYRAEESPISPLDAVAAVSRELDRAKGTRDAAIRDARAAGLSFREVAAAAGLGVTRVQQIVAASGCTRFAVLSAVPELDLPRWPNGDDGTVDQHDRVVALDTVAPWLQEWPSERAFLEESEQRRSGDRYDLSERIYDLEPSPRWMVSYVDTTGEVYAFALDGPSNDEPWKGSLAGPCKLLGHAYSYRLLDAALGTAITVVAHRPGGLAWVYGRVALLNTIVAAIAASDNRRELGEYLETLPDSERPS